MTNGSGFYVFRSGGGAPKYLHKNLASAEAEAKRLSMLYPGEKFIVLKWIETFSYELIVEKCPE